MKFRGLAKTVLLGFTIGTMPLFWPAHAHPGHSAGLAVPPWQEATPWPDRIVVTLPEAPQTSFAVTWRTDDSVVETIAQIAEATEDARFDLAAITEAADTEPLNPARADECGSWRRPFSLGRV